MEKLKPIKPVEYSKPKPNVPEEVKDIVDEEVPF
tara:strand:- start:348 stop:449 length:102 start_codon:yes stop_codon:yes gene_type:complete